MRPFTTHAAAPVTAGPVGGTAEVPTPTVLHAVLDRLVGHGPAAHQVWLPPLDEPPMLGALLRDAEPAQAELAVPIGIVDRPFEQSRVPLTIDLSGAAGNVAVVGAPQTGKSTALRTLIMALAATHDAGRVQFYCLDFGGGALAQVDELPHVGAVAGRAQPQLASRMLAELESAVRFREAFFRDHGIDSVARYRQLRAKSAAESLRTYFLSSTAGQAYARSSRPLRSRSLPWQLKGFHSAYMWRYRQHGGRRSGRRCGIRSAVESSYGWRIPRIPGGP